VSAFNFETAGAAFAEVEVEAGERESERVSTYLVKCESRDLVRFLLPGLHSRERPGVLTHPTSLMVATVVSGVFSDSKADNLLSTRVGRQKSSTVKETRLGEQAPAGGPTDSQTATTPA
jgi:hypothetical protein